MSLPASPLGGRHRQSPRHDVAAGTAGRHIIAGECDDHFPTCRADKHIGGDSADDRGSRCCSGNRWCRRFGRRHLFFCIDLAVELRQATFACEANAVRAARRRGHAVFIRRDFVIIGSRALGQVDDVLRSQGADDRVIATVRAEHDAVRRGECRDVDRVVTGATITL